MAPVYSRVCRERLADEYVSRHDLYAQRLWTDSLPGEFLNAWGLKPVDLPKDFDFEKCSQPVLDALQRRGILEKEPEPGPRGYQVARAMAAGPGPDDERAPFDRRIAMEMFDRKMADAVASGYLNAPPRYSNLPESVPPSAVGSYQSPQSTEPERGLKRKRELAPPAKVNSKPPGYTVATQPRFPQPSPPPPSPPPPPPHSPPVTEAAPSPPPTPCKAPGKSSRRKESHKKRKRQKRREKKEEQKEEKRHQEVLPSGPDMATTPTPTLSRSKSMSSLSVKDVSTSPDAVASDMSHDGESVAPSTGHEPSDNHLVPVMDQKTDASLSANQTTGIESSQLAAKAQETQGYPGPCIVDTEKWRKRVLERTRAEAAEREAQWLASTTQQREYDGMTRTPVVFIPKSYSEPANLHLVKPTPLDPREVMSNIEDETGLELVVPAVNGSQAGEPFLPAHFAESEQPHTAPGFSDESQYSTWCRFWPTCSTHQQSTCGCADCVAGCRSCCCAHQAQDCQHDLYPFEGSFTLASFQASAPYQAAMAVQSECRVQAAPGLEYTTPANMPSTAPRHLPLLSGAVTLQNRQSDQETSGCGSEPHSTMTIRARYAHDLEREMHETCGVKSPEKSEEEEAMAPAMSNLFEMSRRLSSSSSPHGGNGTLSLPPPPRPSLTSRPPLPHVQTSMHRSLSREHDSMAPIVTQEVIAPVSRLGEVAEDLNTPSMYFTPKAILTSSPAGSKSSSFSPLSRDESPCSAADASPARSVENSTGSSDAPSKGKAMMKHVKSLFETAEFADMRIALRPSTTPACEPFLFDVHKAIICQSPYLRDVLHTKMLQGDNDDCVQAFSGPYFTSAHAFRMAIETLYGAEHVSIENIRRHTLYGLGWPDDEGNGTYPFNIARAQTDFALCYAVSGAFMGDFEIIARGMRIAMKLLSWDTVETVLNFGMAVENFMITCPVLVYHSPTSGNSPTRGGSPYQFDPRMEHVREFKYVWAQQALHAAVEFVAANMKPDFKLYDRGQSNLTPTRVPAALHTLPGSHCTDFRLENIQFGSMPSIASLRPTRADILVPSGLLITLPFEVFMAMIEALKARESEGVMTVALMEEIVAERESRRLHALRIFLRHRYNQAPEIPQNELAELAYKEVVKTDTKEDGRSALLRSIVEREWVGFEVANESLLVPRANH